MPRTRPPYAEEFRREAAALIRSGQRSLPEASKSLGVSQQTLRNWLKREMSTLGGSRASAARSERSSGVCAVRTGFSARSGKS